MSCKSLLALAPVVALWFLTGSARAGPCPPPVPACPLPACPEPPVTHTLTIYNGCQVVREKFVWKNDSWHNRGHGKGYDVFCRDCPGSPLRCHGTYCSPCRAEEVACSLKACGKLAWVRPHCR